MRYRVFLFVFFSSVLLLTACGKGDGDSKWNEDIEQSAPSDPEGERFKFKAPLTGVGTNEELPTRSIAVLINNAPQARPQSGLDGADLVYEILAEGPITRFISIYHSKEPKVIGPVRSIRPYFIDIGSGLDAIMVHAGGSPEALRILQNQNMAHLDEVNNASKSFWRESFRSPPHNLYTDLDSIHKGAKSLGIRKNAKTPEFIFADSDSEIMGEMAEEINIRYEGGYRVSYKYDADEEQYNRYIGDEPHTDLTTGDPLITTNLFVISAPHRTLDHEGRRTIDLYGPGKGYLFQQGKAQEVTWERKDGLIRAYQVGEELPMISGNTWVQIIPDDASSIDAVQFN